MALMDILNILVKLSGAVEPVAKLLQKVMARGKPYQMSILRFNEYLYRHFGAYFYTVCTTERRYLDIKSRNERIGLNIVFDALGQGTGPRLILVWAEGGMGKTALAAHIVRTVYVKNRWYNVLLGGSAKQQAFIDGEVRTYDDAVLSFSSLLDLMGNQLGVANIHRIHSPEEKIAFLKRRLRDQRTLIVVDNLETFANTQEIIENLERFVAGTDWVQVLVTSRDGRATGRDLLSVYLPPLTSEEGERFAEWYIKIRRLHKHSATEFTPTLIRGVVDGAGGSPLAIEQLLSQVSFIGVDAIDYMQQVRCGWREFYDFLFANALSRIGQEARRILWFTATLHRPSTYDDYKELAEREGFSPELDKAIKTLVQLDLLKVGWSIPEVAQEITYEEMGVALYSISPLLVNYILRHQRHFKS